MGNPFEERRFGRLQVSMEFLKSAEDHEWALIFGDVRILRAEHVVVSDFMHYEACSPAFEPVEEGAMPPWYVVKATKQSDGLAVEIVRKDIQREWS